MNPIQPSAATSRLRLKAAALLLAWLFASPFIQAVRAESDPAHCEATSETAVAWPGGVIPYDLSRLSERQQAHALKAMQRWMNTGANIRFVPRTNETEYVNFTGRTDAGNNTSFVGYQKGRRADINITAFWWGDEWMAVHELGHVLGFFHEHTRWDRDRYVTIHYENIKPGRSHDYDWAPQTNWLVRTTAYDYRSIMHYRVCWASSCESDCRDADGTSPCAVISPVERKYDGVIGQWGDNGISAGDVEKVRLAYGEKKPLSFRQPIAMTFAEANKRHAELTAEIRRHDHAYYVEGRPLITDREYDQLFKELQELEKNFPDLITPESPTQRVGGAPSEKFTRVQHLIPMLSLDKIAASDHPTKDEEPDRDKRNRAQDENTLAELRAFDATLRKQLGRDKIQYILEPKVDGVSISVHYRHGKLALGVTRGDGTAGDDITANLKTVRGIPLELRSGTGVPPVSSETHGRDARATTLLEVRGEAYMATTEFDALNAKSAAAGEKSFPNARNATAGTLKQLDPRLVAQRPIRAVFYAVGAVDGIEFQTHSEMLEALARFGLPTQKLWWVCDGIDEVLKIYADKVVAHYDEDRDLRRQLPYEIDGIVLKVNTLADWPRIPGRSRAPGYAIVHKPVPWITPAETVLRAITVQVGRTGVLTPVAELEPVFVQGSTIARATLHNEDEIRRKDIRIGDTVVIRKAGMVIPEIFEVVKTKRLPGAEEFDLFKHVGGKCPACGGPIAKDVKSGGTSSTSPKTTSPQSKPTNSQGLVELVPPTENDEVAWRCQNIAGCPAQLTRRVEYFAQRKALDLESLGGIVAEKLVERGLVKEPLDLFDLKLEALGKLNLGTDDEPRTFGEKNATKILDALQRAKTAPLARWILALGVPSVGETTAYQLAQLHKDIEKISHSEILKQCLLLYEKVEEAKSLSPDSMINMGPIRRERIDKEKMLELETDAAKQQRLKTEIDLLSTREKDEWRQRIEQQGKVNDQIEELVKHLQKAGVVLKVEKKEKQKKKNKELAPPILEVTAEIELDGARNLLRFFQTSIGKKIIKRLDTLGIHPTGSVKKSQVEALAFTGKTFVLTGTLPTLSRDDASVLIRDAGGNVTSSVSKNTDFLLAGEEAGSKLDKAKELGVQIISEGEFLKLLEASNKKEKATEKTNQSELF